MKAAMLCTAFEPRLAYTFTSIFDPAVTLVVDGDKYRPKAGVPGVAAELKSI